MGLFDLFKKDKEDNSNRNGESMLIEHHFNAILEEAISKSDNYSITPVQNLLSFKELKKKEETFLKDFLFFSLDNVKRYKEKWNENIKPPGLPDRSSKWPVSMKISAQVLKSILFLSDGELLTIIKKFKEGCDEKYYYLAEIPYTVLLEKAAALISKNGITGPVTTALQLLAFTENDYMYAERRKINEKINFLLQGSPGAGFNKHDRFGNLLTSFFNTLDIEQRANWSRLFISCKSAAGKAAPTQKWLVDIKTILQQTGKDQFAVALKDWLLFNKELIRGIHKDGSYSYDFLRDENHNLLKGLIWCAGIVNDPELNVAMDEYATWAFKKMPGVGPISAKTGTACMYAFEMLPFKEGISKLVKFKMKIKNNTILKSIDKIIKQAAEKNGFTEDLVMEIGVPDFGLNDDATLITAIGEYNAVFTIKGIGDTELLWEKNGKYQKAIPQQIKTVNAAELKFLKNTIKEIEELLPIQKERIEKLYLNKSSWKYEDWFQHYIQHPLVSIIAKKLIWHFANGEGKKGEGIFENGRFINAGNQLLDWINTETEVQLWHPIGFAAEEILHWRNFLQEKEILQPFKQAYREIYILTDAEVNTATYSNRFAAHILRQHQFAALCRQRGWSYHLMGQWDSHNTPTILFPKWNIRAEFYVDADWNAMANDSGIFNYIGTDQLRFYKGASQLHMTDVPAMVFTEVMRDLDLFVGVTSIGNDAAWQDAGDSRMNTYWHEYSFGDLTESSKIRSEVLKNLIPRLKIADRCTFDGKYLHVKGRLRNYKIHMGSGNILMEPNDQYLCIVPDRKGNNMAEKIFLPFEGDNMLSIIISKAFLLVDDDKISDPTITRQINN